MKEIISIDLGSNSFRVLKYDGINHKIIDEFQIAVGLADGLSKSGVISSEAQDRVVKAYEQSREKLNYNPSEAISVTTAAMRMAKNSQEVLGFFKEKCNLNFKIIDGDEEAKLTLLAVKYALKRENIQSEKFILVDIGGGSTELIINNGDEFFVKSFNIGILTLTQKSNDIKELEVELEKYKSYMKDFTKSLSIDLSDYCFVATAGTPTTIAAVKLGMNFESYDKNKVNGHVLSLNDIDEFFNDYKKLSSKESEILVGTGRNDYIHSGVFIYKALYEVFAKKESIVFDDGLREGVAIQESLARL